MSPETNYRPTDTFGLLAREEFSKELSCAMTKICSELWIENEFGRGVVVSVPKTSLTNVPAEVLMDHRFRSLAGFATPEKQ